MTIPWVDLAPEHRAVVTAIDTSPASAEFPGEVCGLERRLILFEGRGVERTIQLAARIWHQQTPDPDVHVLIKLELPDRIEQTDINCAVPAIGCLTKWIAPLAITIKAFGVELELDDLRDSAVDIDTGVADPEAVVVTPPIRRPVFHRREPTTSTHSKRNPQVPFLALDDASRVSTRQRGCHPSQQHYGGPGNQQCFPPSNLACLHGECLPVISGL